MSLEDRIAELNTNIVALIAAIKTHGAVTVAKVNPEGEFAPIKEQSEEKKPQPVASVSPEKSGQASSTTANASDSGATPVVTYDDVRKLITDVARGSKDKAVAMLGRFGVQNGKQLTEDQYAEFHAYALKVKDGEVDPESADA